MSETTTTALATTEPRKRSTPSERGYRPLSKPQKPTEMEDPLKDVSGLYITVDEKLSKRFTLAFANNLCFRLRLLFIVFNLDTVIGAQLGTPSYVTFLPDMACAKKFGIDTEAYIDAVEELLQGWLLQVITTLFSEANYLLKEGRDEAEILAELCPWYDSLKGSTIKATSLDDIPWLSWVDPAVIAINRQAERRARKEKAKADKDYRPNNKVVDQLQQMEEYKNLAISVAAKAAARQAYAAARKSAAADAN